MVEPPGVDPQDPEAWVRVAAHAADDKIGQDTVVLEVGAVLAVTDHFLITAGANNRQVRAIAEHIEEQVAHAGGPKPRSVEGIDTYDWVLLDYGDFVVHVFEQSVREHYDLERLWSDVPRLKL